MECIEIERLVLVQIRLTVTARQLVFSLLKVRVWLEEWMNVIGWISRQCPIDFRRLSEYLGDLPVGFVLFVTKNSF